MSIRIYVLPCINFPEFRHVIVLRRHIVHKNQRIPVPLGQTPRALLHPKARWLSPLCFVHLLLPCTRLDPLRRSVRWTPCLIRNERGYTKTGGKIYIGTFDDLVSAICLRAASATAKAPSSAVSNRTQANSSPPIRATAPVDRVAALFKRRPTSLKCSSPLSAHGNR